MIDPGLKQAALSGARWTVAARIGLQLFTWPVTILIIRVLEPADYGLFAMAMVTIGFIALFSEIGLGVALVQAQVLDDAAKRAACTLIMGCNALLALAIATSAPLVATAFDEPDLVAVVQVLSVELVISSLAAVPQANLERQLRFKDLSIAAMAGGVVSATLALTGALLGWGVWSLVAGNLTLAAVRSALLIAFHGHFVWPALSGQAAIRPLIAFGGHILAGRCLWYWYGQADQIVLARILHASMLGYYSVASQLAMMPASKGMEAINRVIFPIVSRTRSDLPGLRRSYQRLVRLVATYAFAACWGLAAVAPELVAVILGEKWLSAATPLMLLSAVAPLRMLTALNNTVASAAGSPQASTKELALAGVLMPAAVVAGAWIDGLRGACMAWLISYPPIFLVSDLLTCAAIGHSTRAALRAVVAPLAAASLMWLSVLAIRAQLVGATHPALLLALELVVAPFAYVISLYVIAPGLTREAGALALDFLLPRRSTRRAAIHPG